MWLLCVLVKMVFVSMQIIHFKQWGITEQHLCYPFMADLTLRQMRQSRLWCSAHKRDDFELSAHTSFLCYMLELPRYGLVFDTILLLPHILPLIRRVHSPDEEAREFKSLVPTVSPKSDFCANPIEIRSYLNSLNGNELHEIRFVQICFELH